MEHEVWSVENQIKAFRDLNAWKLGHESVLGIYRLAKTFPSFEQFGLGSQMRRAAVSVTSNIAEGFNRSSLKEKAQFYSMSLGSVAELQAQLLIAVDLGYCSDASFRELMAKLETVHRLLNGLIKSTKLRMEA